MHLSSVYNFFIRDDVVGTTSKPTSILKDGLKGKTPSTGGPPIMKWAGLIQQKGVAGDLITVYIHWPGFWKLNCWAAVFKL